MVLNCTLAIIYLIFRNYIWKSPIVKKVDAEVHSKDDLMADLKSTHINTKLIFIILSLTMFTLGYNAYGIQSSWRHVALAGKILAHSSLMSFLKVLSKLLALMVCLAVKQKRLPLSVLQLFLALTYFCSLSFEKENFKKDVDSFKSVFAVFLVHISDFFDCASFSLMWIITPESYPHNFRWRNLIIILLCFLIQVIFYFELSERDLLDCVLELPGLGP